MAELATYYDAAVIGGGLAGLAAAIRLRQLGHRTVMFEKENYPFHKVCGEYISFESWELLTSLGLPLAEMQLPRIGRLMLSSPSGKLLEQKLPLGGFGISRYKIDHALAGIARSLGVVVREGTKVNDVQFLGNEFLISADGVDVRSRACCGSFGKRSNLDLKWKRKFAQRRPNALNNFVGVKYHALLDHPNDTIALHYFKDGYCGISPLENGRTCICYLTTAQNLRAHGGSIAQMEREVLFKNQFLREAFGRAKILYDKPLTISQISFERKEQVAGHVLLAGDAAGLITPLCGNGMSMALGGGSMAADHIDALLKNTISRDACEAAYAADWRQQFSRRLRAGRMIQSAFGSEAVTNLSVSVLKHFPSLVRTIIRQTHG